LQAKWGGLVFSLRVEVGLCGLDWPLADRLDYWKAGTAAWHESISQIGIQPTLNERKELSNS
jgi:hypothetical protein